jgi:hypothetical protein
MLQISRFSSVRGLSFLSFCSVASLSVFAVACGSAPDSSESTATANQDVKRSMYACQVDDDCTAIPALGCCPDGSDVAVNVHKVAAYESSHVCTQQQICPRHIIVETRVAECDNSTKKCVMIQPTDIHCGGNIRNAHACTSGFSCDFHGHPPDVGGSCAKTCIENKMCMTTEHFDHTACTCVPN